MTHALFPVRKLPRLAAWLLMPLPLQPFSLFLTHAVRAMAERHPELFTRLGEQANKRFLIDPTDFPFSFLLRPQLSNPQVEAFSRSVTRGWDCRIGGPLTALLGMVHGTFDGDALFFSRDIIVEGDMEAVLALRNALDDAEIDLFEEVVRCLGLPDQILGLGWQPVARLGGVVAGLPLTRMEPRR